MVATDIIKSLSDKQKKTFIKLRLSNISWAPLQTKITQIRLDKNPNPDIDHIRAVIYTDRFKPEAHYMDCNRIYLNEIDFLLNLNIL